MHLQTTLRAAGRSAASMMVVLAATVAGVAAQGPGGPPAPSALARAGAVRPGEALMPYDAPFAEDQLRYPRVRDARVQVRFGIKRLFRERGLSYPAAEIYLRVFKRERQLELWVRPAAADTFALLRTYPICALAGVFGPKRRQGDWQTPEGFYEIDHFNPTSQYHLSLHVDYPNRSDRLRASGGSLGGEIFIHGGCQTEGCIALTDDAIKELYWLSVEARAAGQPRIPVHIFPVRLTDDEIGRIGAHFEREPELQRFWTNLKPGYDHFEATRQLPRISVDGRGRYVIEGRTGLTEEAAVLGRPVSRPPRAEPPATAPRAGSDPAAAADRRPGSDPAPGAGGPVVLGTRLDPETLEPVGAEPELEPVPPDASAALAAVGTGAGTAHAVSERSAPGGPIDRSASVVTAGGRPGQGPPRLAAAHAARLAAAAQPLRSDAEPDPKGAGGG